MLNDVFQAFKAVTANLKPLNLVNDCHIGFTGGGNLKASYLYPRIFLQSDSAQGTPGFQVEEFSIDWTLYDQLPVDLTYSDEQIAIPMTFERLYYTVRTIQALLNVNPWGLNFGDPTFSYVTNAELDRLTGLIVSQTVTRNRQICANSFVASQLICQ